MGARTATLANHFRFGKFILAPRDSHQFQGHLPRVAALAVFGNFINRAVVLTHKYWGGKTPILNSLNEYDKTVFIEEALHRLVEVYYKLGLEDEAKQAAVILGYNYKSSKWYSKSYKVFNKKYKPRKIEKKKEMGFIRRKIKKLFE